MKLHQGGMSVTKYSSKFIKLSKYSSSLVSNAKNEMGHLVTGMSEELEEKCCETMLQWFFLG